MAGQSPTTGSKIELAALGRPVLREDFIRDLDLRLGLIFVAPSQNDLIKLFSQRLRIRSTSARTVLDQLMISLENRPEAFQTELKKLRDVVHRCSTIDFNESNPVAEAFYSYLEAEAEDFIKLQKLVAREWKEFQDYLETRSEVVANIPKALKALTSENGFARQSAGRELKHVFNLLFNTVQELPPVVPLTYVWVSSQIGESDSDFAQVLGKANLSVNASGASHLICRYLSEIYTKEGNLPRAIEWSKLAIEHQNTAEANVEAALLASELHEPSYAKPFIEEALMQRPGSVMSFLADERSVGLGVDFLDIVVRVQMRLRREGRQHAIDWAESAKEVLEKQRSLGLELPISHELLEGHKTVEARLADADIIVAGSLIRYCDTSQADLKKSVKSCLEKEFDHKRDELTAARLSIDAIGANREKRVQSAKAENDKRLSSANAQLNAINAKAKAVERQSLLLFSSGCGLFGLFVLAKLFLHNVDALNDLSSGLGLFCLLVSGVPILIAVGLQIHHGVTRAAMEAIVREKVLDANRKFSQIELEANDVHRDQLAVGRKNLAETEAQLKKIETALRTISWEAKASDNASARIKAA